MKDFVKAMNQNGEAFNKFPVLSQAKLKEGIFVGPQINKLHVLKDEDFNHTLSKIKKVAWNFEIGISRGGTQLSWEYKSSKLY